MYSTFLIEGLAVGLTLGGLAHATRLQGGEWARQWFVGAYLAALIRETLNQVIFQIYVFPPDTLRVGAAPALITLLSGSVAYLAFQFARRFVAPTQPILFTGLVLLIAASFALPLEATAAQMQWWVYMSPTPLVFGAVPLTALLVWGGGAAIYYAVFQRVRGARLPERGKFYAIVAVAPLVAAAQLLLAVLLNA